MPQDEIPSLRPDPAVSTAPDQLGGAIYAGGEAEGATGPHGAAYGRHKAPRGEDGTGGLRSARPAGRRPRPATSDVPLRQRARRPCRVRPGRGDNGLGRCATLGPAAAGRELAHGLLPRELLEVLLRVRARLHI